MVDGQIRISNTVRQGDVGSVDFAGEERENRKVEDGVFAIGTDILIVLRTWDFASFLRLDELI